jgi:heme/copper-type cytochrome/quinol oxidase subunit 1
VLTPIGDLDLVGTTWMTAQADLVLLGAALAGLAGVAFWAPKIYGKLLPDGLVRLGATLVALGALVAAVPQAVAGLVYDQARFVAGGTATVDPGDLDTVETLDLVSAIGLAVVVLGGLAAAAALAARRRRDPGDDPWDGHTLEWTTSSPPPVGNFATVPAITSEAPLYDARHAAATDATEASA